MLSWTLYLGSYNFEVKGLSMAKVSSEAGIFFQA